MAVENLPEPMMRLNHSGYGIKIKDLVTIATLIFVGGGAYFLVDYKLDEIAVVAKTNTQAITQATAEVKATLSSEVGGLESKIEVNRVERNEDIRRLYERVGEGEKDRAALTAKVDGLEDLMRDIRDLLRKSDDRDSKAEFPDSSEFVLGDDKG